MKRRNTLRRLVRHPNGDRAAETTNNLAEDMFDLVTRARAIEAAAFWRAEAERMSQRLMLVRSTAVLKATELVHDVCKESELNAAGQGRREATYPEPAGSRMNEEDTCTQK
jgi:hypothetical protein